MVFALIFAMLILPISGSINCRIACTRCAEGIDHAEILEVYCAMCDECKERRREWLRNADRNARVENKNYFISKESYLDDDCLPQVTQEPCDPRPLVNRITTSTEATTSTSTTTLRPCTPKPHCKLKPACVAVPCIPAVPICNTCPTEPSTTISSLSLSIPPEPYSSRVEDRSKSSEPLSFYVGVPKKILKELNLLRS